jgi:6,7-dimethyl-8-ribityllumazine synthase
MRGVCELALEAKVAVGNAILTVENSQQATERSGQRSSNKGWEAALAALAMANHFRRLR